jgi:hypothetical protein
LDEIDSVIVHTAENEDIQPTYEEVTCNPMPKKAQGGWD